VSVLTTSGQHAIMAAGPYGYIDLAQNGVIESAPRLGFKRSWSAIPAEIGTDKVEVRLARYQVSRS